MDKKLDKDTIDIINSFITETLELIEDTEDKILKLNPENSEEIINTIFRAFHSIKGNSLSLNFNNVKNLTHEAETFLDFFRKQKKLPGQEEIDILYQVCDLIKKLMSCINNEYSDKGFEDETEVLIQSIKKLLEHNKNIDKNVLDNTGLENKEQQIKISSLITPEIVDSYIEESNEIFDKLEKKLLDLEKKPDDMEFISDIFRSVHTFKGNTSFIGLCRLEERIHQIETLLDKARNNNFAIDQKVITFLLSNVDAFRRLINSINTKTLEIDEELFSKIKQMADLNYSIENAKPIGEILIEMGESKEESIEKALEIQKEMNIKALETDDLRKKSIRVDTFKLDKLFELVGEMITAGVMVANNVEITSANTESSRKSINYFNKITRELQELTMAIRMIPLEGLFNKMKRLIRDLSKKFNKKINLEVFGEETEMDKNVIEEISDPLVHILRNAIDHGIESNEKRISNNKNETGTIKLGAKYEGNEIWIIVEDDGAGLDKEKIIKKAKEKGLFKHDPKKLTDEEINAIIFEPGFSTAETVSEISGRGVGLDVVKKNIDKLRGKIEIKSQANIGTTITLRIPLTMAIQDVVNVRIGGGMYSISLIDTLEFCKVQESQITYVQDKKEVLKLRNELIPIIKLHEFFKIKTNIREIIDGVAIIVISNEQKACFLVDEVIGNQQIVVKSLSNYLNNSRGLSGCSILGNGEVSLIIDTGAVINESLKYTVSV